MKKNKIIILSNDTTYTYNLRDEILERLVSDGSEVVIVSQPLLFQDELTSLGCQLIPMETNRHGKNPFSDMALMFRYKRLLLEEKPDVVLSYNIKPNVYGGLACRLTKTRYIPNITGLGTAVEYPGVMQKLSTRLYKMGVSKADCVFFQNSENQEFFVKHKMVSKQSRMRLLPGSGVNLRLHKPLEYPIESDVIHFLFVARVMKEKGIDLYLNVARQIYEKNRNVLFHICGKCDDEKYVQILNEAMNEGYVKYHGEQKNMIPFFQMAHCVVHPSYYPEGMSNVLLEAAAHCRPIITTNRSGCRETVDDGESGFVIPIKDDGALSSAIERFIALTWDEKRKMGLKGRAKVEKEFDRQIVVEAYCEEINKSLLTATND